MNIVKAKKALLRVKAIEWSQSIGEYEKGLRLRAAKADLRGEILSGLVPIHKWRGSIGTGGRPNRRQRKHADSGLSYYRNGFHWTIAERLTIRNI